jgi:hypothetical protein
MEQMHLLFLQYNWTPANLGLMTFGIIIVEMGRVIGRDSSKTAVRTKFSWRYWFSQPNNWRTPMLTIACSLAALALMDAMCPPSMPASLYAFGSGAVGQALIKIALKAFGGATGAEATKTV